MTTDTAPMAPTDAEIIALADATRTAEGGANGYMLPKRDDLIHTMLCALVQSSPYTDRTYAWKSDAWARQRAEAISAAIAWLGEVRG